MRTLNRTAIATVFSALWAVAATAQAAPQVVQVTATPSVVNAAAAADAFVPANGTVWTTSSAYWDNAGSITFKLDQAYRLSALTVTADWNDIYRFSVSTNGVNFTQLVTVSGLFDQPAGANVTAGQVTMPTSFAPTALAYQYVRVESVFGDTHYAIGEVSFAGTAAPVPEPSTLAFMAAGLGVVGFVARRRRPL